MFCEGRRRLATRHLNGNSNHKKKIEGTAKSRRTSFGNRGLGWEDLQALRCRHFWPYGNQTWHFTLKPSRWRPRLDRSIWSSWALHQAQRFILFYMLGFHLTRFLLIFALLFSYADLFTDCTVIFASHQRNGFVMSYSSVSFLHKFKFISVSFIWFFQARFSSISFPDLWTLLALLNLFQLFYETDVSWIRFHFTLVGRRSFREELAEYLTGWDFGYRRLWPYGKRVWHLTLPVVVVRSDRSIWSSWVHHRPLAPAPRRYTPLPPAHQLPTVL